MNPRQGAEWLSVTVAAQIAVVLLVGLLVVMVLRRLRQPTVVGEIAAGIALGPSLLGLLPGNPTERLFPASTRPALSAIAQIGVLLFMFVVGWEFEALLLRGRSRSMLGTLTAAFVVPMILGSVLAAFLYHGYGAVNGVRPPFTTFALYLGVTVSITAFPVLARIITDHHLQGTSLGTTSLALAAASDLLGWTALAVVVAMAAAQTGMALALHLALIAGYVAGMILLVRPLLGWFCRRMVARDGSDAYLVTVVASGLLLSAYATSTLGIHSIFGAFIFGMVMPRQPRAQLTLRVLQPIESAAVLFMPLFFVVTGLSVNAWTLGWSGALVTLLVIAVGCVGKMGSVLLASRAFGASWRHASQLGVLMNTRGLTEIIVLNIGLSIGMLNPRLFTIFIIMALVTTAMTGPLLHAILGRPAEEAVDRGLADARTGQRPAPDAAAG